MGHIYPGTWAQHCGDVAWVDGMLTDAAQTWRAVLSGITPRQVADGFSRLAGRNKHWPPSAPEFRALCLPDRSHATAAYRTPPAALPRPLADPVKAAVVIASARTATGRTAHARRSVMLPGEGLGDYQSALSEALNKGISKSDFDWLRLEANGWTRAEESTYPPHYRFS